MFEGGGALGWNVLAAFVDVRLDHDAGDMAFASRELRADVREDLRLIHVVFLRVPIYSPGRGRSDRTVESRGDRGNADRHGATR